MRYALYFAISVVCLTTGTVVTFDRLSLDTLSTTRIDSIAPLPVADTLPTRGVYTPPVPTVLDYARFAEADQAWRHTYARQYSLDELRARGDGKRSARDSVQDRVFQYMQSSQRRRAILELEHWVSKHPADTDMLLPLARLLAEDGRGDDAIRRYRQILALQSRGG